MQTELGLCPRPPKATSSGTYQSQLWKLPEPALEATRTSSGSYQSWLCKLPELALQATRAGSGSIKILGITTSTSGSPLARWSCSSHTCHSCSSCQAPLQWETPSSEHQTIRSIPSGHKNTIHIVINVSHHPQEVAINLGSTFQEIFGCESGEETAFSSPAVAIWWCCWRNPNKSEFLGKIKANLEKIIQDLKILYL